jgi:phage baseplate assembly protein W
MAATYTDLTTPKNLGKLVINEIHDDIAISNSLKNIFSTPKGSLPGKPYFGTILHQMLFEPIDIITEEIMIGIIKNEIAKFEPRISIISISFDNLPEYNKVVINIQYKYKRKEEVIISNTAIPIRI